MIHNIKFPDGTTKAVECKIGSGAFDKNGREIFEGDFVKFKGSVGGTASVLVGEVSSIDEAVFKVKYVANSDLHEGVLGHTYDYGNIDFKDVEIFND